MDDSQIFNILEVNNIKTNKLEYTYNNNIIYINKLNAKHIKLNSSYSNSYLVTQDNSMDIDIKLSSQIIGTKYRILITNRQNTFKLSCVYNNDKFKGIVKINNNSSTVNQDTLNNNLRKKNTYKSDYSDILYIPSYKLGLYNGGYIDIIYTGNKYNNVPISNENGYWMVYGELIGNINIPKNIIPLTTTTYILTIYILPSTSKIICVTTKNPVTNHIYFNKINNNNISIFLDLTYTVQIITVNDNTLVYNSDSYNSSISSNIYNIEICNNLLTTNTNTFISLKDANPGNINKNNLKFISEFKKNSLVSETLKYNINEPYNTNIVEYKKLNIINFNIKNSSTVVIDGFFNIISCKSYNSNNNTDIILPSLLFGNFNIFTDSENKIILDENKY